jgi:hypothetical protein
MEARRMIRGFLLVAMLACSLPAFALQTYFVNRCSSAGGDGTTNGTAGATRAFLSLSEAEGVLDGGTYTSEGTSDITIYGKQFDDIAIQIILDKCGTPTNDATQVSFDTSWATSLDGTHRLLVRAADGTSIAGQSTTDSRHLGVFGAGYKITATSANVGALRLQSANIIVLDVEAESTHASSGRGMQTSAVASWLINVLGTTASTGAPAFEIGNGTILVNCIGKNSATTVIADNGASNTSTRVYNCGAVAGSTLGLSNNAGEYTAKNTWAFGSGTSDFETGASGFDSGSDTNNASEDSSAPGANPETGLVSTAATDFVDYAGGDYAPQSGGSLDGEGADLSADGSFPFAFDIAGATRSSWSIGPFNTAAGGGGTTPLRRRRN